MSLAARSSRLRVLLVTVATGLLLAATPSTFAQAGEAAKPQISPTATGIISTFAGDGTATFSGDGLPAIQAGLFSPEAVVVDKAGNAYIADEYNHRIRKVATNGFISTIAGGGTCEFVAVVGYCGDGGKATNAEFTFPQAIALDNANNLYVADYFGNVVRKIDLTTGIITAFAGFPTCTPIGSTQSCSGGKPGFSGDGGLATKALLNSPSGIAVDAAGNVYIADSANYRIRVVAAATGIISTFAGGGTGCGTTGDAYGNGCKATDATLYYPSAIAFDKSGNLYLADTGCTTIECTTVVGDQEIRKVTLSTKIVSAVAGGGSGTCAAATDKLGDNCPASNTVIARPSGLVFDTNGNLYFSDAGNNSIRVVNAANNIVTIVAGGNGPGSTGDGSAATLAQLSTPLGITLDATGNLYIADSLNTVVRKVTYSATQKVTATPTATPKPGTYSVTTPVVLADATAGATIYYTLDGTTPTIPATGTTTLYTGSIPVSETTTIKAIAQAANYLVSTQLTGAYIIQAPPAAPTFSPAGGIFSAAQTVTIADTTPGVTIYYTLNGTIPTAASTQYTAPIVVNASETIKAVAVASGVSSAVASAAYTIQAATPIFSPAVGTYPATPILSVTITSATPGAAIYYTTNGTNPTTASTRYTAAIPVPKTTIFKVIAVAAGYANSTPASATYTIEQVVAAPTFSVASGTYTSLENVTLTTTTPGAAIHYTLDGTQPTATSPKYTAPLAIGKSSTINAIATATGLINSTVATAAYTLVGSPSALSAPAVAIATPRATLRAIVNTLGLTGSYVFQYGTSATALTGTTVKTNLAASTNPVTASATLTTLAAKTTYYYQVVVTTAGGSSSGSILSFTTN